MTILENIKSKMKEKQKTSVKRSSVGVALFSALLVSACGGGSSGNSSGDAAVSNLSATQAAYENVALVANGGLHYLTGNLQFSTSTTGTASLDPASYFFSTTSSVAQSPANGPQLVSVSYTPVASTLATPVPSGVNRYLINGSVMAAPVPEQPQVSYSGQNILENYLATDGKTVLHSFLSTSDTFVPLSGMIASSPGEVLNNSNLGLITNAVNGQPLYNPLATWEPGSGYLKIIRQYSGDTVPVVDCNPPDTTGTSLTPCSTTVSTLEAFFPITIIDDNNTTYQLSDGQIVTLAGMRAWVANAPIAADATTTYRMFYQSNGAIYTGFLIKDDTPLQAELLGSTTPQDFYIFLNGAALNSVKAAIKF
jgi:hypothetical protein